MIKKILLAYVFLELRPVAQFIFAGILNELPQCRHVSSAPLSRYIQVYKLHSTFGS